MITVRTMTFDDLSLGMRLKTEVKWNQTAADWRRFLNLAPDGCFVAESDGEEVGTLSTCQLGSVAWIAMVLVDARMRGQGIGTALMSHALAYLDARRVPTVRLDATPLGQPVYEKLGFVAEYQLSRYEGTLSSGTTAPGVLPYTSDLLDVIAQLDQEIAGTDRRALLTRLLAEFPGETRVLVQDDRLTGYCTARPGANATFLGPCMAATAAAGTALLADAFTRYAGQAVLVDIPVDNTPAIAAAEAAGLQVQRPFLRMYRGATPVDQPAGIWASSGPEKG
ncbi:MAG: GNAT family N-acetyltransferase [Armatimonadota bacterium]